MSAKKKTAKARELCKPYRCRVCHCTHYRACDNGCGWAPGRGDLCTNCAAIADAIVDYKLIAYRFNLTGLMREVGSAE